MQPEERLQKQAAIARAGALQQRLRQQQIQRRQNSHATALGYDADSGLDRLQLPDGSIILTRSDTSGVRAAGDTVLLQGYSGTPHLDAPPARKREPQTQKPKRPEVTFSFCMAFNDYVLQISARDNDATVDLLSHLSDYPPIFNGFGSSLETYITGGLVWKTRTQFYVAQQQSITLYDIGSKSAIVILSHPDLFNRIEAVSSCCQHSSGNFYFEVYTFGGFFEIFHNTTLYRIDTNEVKRAQLYFYGGFNSLPMTSVAAPTVDILYKIYGGEQLVRFNLTNPTELTDGSTIFQSNVILQGSNATDPPPQSVWFGYKLNVLFSIFADWEEQSVYCVASGVETSTNIYKILILKCSLIGQVTLYFVFPNGEDGTEYQYGYNPAPTVGIIDPKTKDIYIKMPRSPLEIGFDDGTLIKITGIGKKLKPCKLKFGNKTNAQSRELIRRDWSSFGHIAPLLKNNATNA